MPKCRHCGTKLDSKWRYCPACGKTGQSGLMHLTDEMVDEVFGQLLSANSDLSAAAAESSKTKFGTGVRAQVFEVIVRQAIAGAPWRQLCAGPMKVNGITEEDVDRELRRRAKNKELAAAPEDPKPSDCGINMVVSLSSASELLNKYRLSLVDISQNNELDLAEVRQQIDEVSMKMLKLVLQVRQLEQNQQNNN